MFVRVVENENSEILLKSGDTTVEEATTTGVDENSNVYTIEGNGSDVNIELKDVTVEGIAVTNLWKECSFWDETEEHTDGAEETGYYCYNSDSHDKPIKYSLTQYYTNVFMKALTVKSTNSEDNTVEVADIDYTPAYTGVIVYSIDKGIDHPLFVPAVNDQKSKAEDEAIKAASMMIPHVESGEVAASDEDSIRYVFTNVYNKVSDVGTKISANTPGFYQVNRTGVLKANREQRQQHHEHGDLAPTGRRVFRRDLQPVQKREPAGFRPHRPLLCRQQQRLEQQPIPGGGCGERRGADEMRRRDALETIRI